MRKILGPLAGAFLLIAAQPAAAAGDDAGKLAQAHAIIEVMFPVAQRQHMFDRLLTQLTHQFSGALPATVMSDPGVKAIVDEFMSRAHDRQLAVLEKHMPDILEATAVAYTHQFSLAELKDIHAFAETPSGARYMSRATEVLGDPAVAKANTALIADAEALSSTMLPEFKEKLLTYVKAHPDVAAKFADAYKAK